MKIIKFRGKRIDNGEWVYGYYMYSYLKKGHLILSDTNNYEYRINPKTIGQFTGLQDSKGKDIWEGDIVRYQEEGWGMTGDFTDEVEYKGGAFYPLCERPSNLFEIIGNIHENPELL